MPTMPNDEILALKDCFIRQLSPRQIYLFGSYATGTFNADSDFDFFIVVDDPNADLTSLISQAYKCIRKIKKHPVDIIVGTRELFEKRKLLPTLEREVFQKGILLYAA